MKKKLFPAEWHKQYGVALTFPHADSDWAEDLMLVIPVFVNLANIISKHEQVIIICDQIEKVKALLTDANQERITYVLAESNDTWARDHMPLTVLTDGLPVLVKYRFNGWGLKFPANLDNTIAYALKKYAPFDEVPMEEGGIVLEGGALETDGMGTLLSTTACMGSINRNPHLNQEELEKLLTEQLGVDTFLWLHHGYLAGDDTDSHIDTLARFCDANTIVYVSCEDEEDEHYAALKRMEKELYAFKNRDGKAYQLVPLPMAPTIYDKAGQRLPATYANFLIINEAVLVPVYGDDALDNQALDILSKCFPDRKIYPVNCEVLIRQHGSLHCVTMQFPIELSISTEIN